MRRNSIKNAYDTLKPDELQRERMLENILQQASVAPNGRKDVTMPKKNRLFLIAAVISLAVLLMGSAIVALRMEDLQIAYSPKFPEETGDRALISLQGFAGTRQFQASQEWHTFRESYDTGLEQMYEAERNDFLAPAKYDGYGCYTQEMMEKVDEICEKYGLNHLGELLTANNAREILDAMGIERITADGKAEDKNNNGNCGYFFRDGSFHMELTSELPDH